MGYAKTLFLVYNKKTYILIRYIRRQDSMGSDHNIHKSLFQVLDGLFLLPACPEPGQQINPHRIIFHPLYKGIIMLLGQDRGRNQIHHLLSFLYRLKSCPDGDFRLTIAHIPADQPVHDLGAFHILFGGLNGRKLVFRFLKRE